VTDGGAAGPAGRSGSATPVRTIFIGSGRFAQPILGRLAGHPSIELVGVVSAPPRPVGRRQV
jgi:methionyl-tRNA formyltransferase